jgi:hypothetical protein
LGSSGGGLIHVLAAGAVLVDGSLLASGGDVVNSYPGCGSGGGIYVHCNSFAGSGLLKANGGKSGRNAPDFGGSGGGGRIAVACVYTGNWSGAVQAKGGEGDYTGNTGANGTVVWIRLSPPPGTLIMLE